MDRQLMPFQKLLPVLCLFAAMAGSPCYAGLSFTGYEWSWSSVSDNGQFVFVCLFPDPLQDQIDLIEECDDDPPYFTRAAEVAEVERLHHTYPSTGMYLNNGSTTPLWTTSEEVFCGKPTPDGRRVFYFDNDYGFSISVADPSQPTRSLREIEVIGWLAFFLYRASDSSEPYFDTYAFDATSQHFIVTWEGGTTTTIRLDDFAIVQSNVLPHAFFQLFTTMQGIVVFLVFVLITGGVAYGITRCFMGAGKGREARR